jgi:hypothetical protein
MSQTIDATSNARHMLMFLLFAELVRIRVERRIAEVEEEAS